METTGGMSVFVGGAALLSFWLQVVNWSPSPYVRTIPNI